MTDRLNCLVLAKKVFRPTSLQERNKFSCVKLELRKVYIVFLLTVVQNLVSKVSVKVCYQAIKYRSVRRTSMEKMVNLNIKNRR